MRVGALLVWTSFAVWAGEVAGLVLDERKQEPVARATATLVSQQGGGRYVTTTDPDGRFLFRGLPPGRYSLRVSRRGFLDFEGLPGQLGPAAVAVGEGDAGSKELRVLLRLPGAIEGEVVDEDGAPFVEARVRARRVSEVGGETRYTWREEAEVDDEGRFRVFGLPPGRYVVEAAPPPQQPLGESVLQPALDDPDGERLDDAYLPTYYPNAVDPSQAVSVRVGRGEERSGLYIRLVPRRALRLTGSLTGYDGPPRVDLIRIGYGGAVEYLEPSRLSADAGFEFRGLSTGQYVLAAQSGQGAAWVGAAEKLSLTDSHVLDYEVRLRPAIPIFGRVLVAGGGETRPDTAWTTLAPVGMPGDLRLTARASEYGRFSVDRALPGIYRVESEGYSSTDGRRYYLREVRFDGRKLDDHQATVQEGVDAHQLEVELGQAPTLSGRVVGEPKGATVVAWLAERDGPAETVPLEAERSFYFDGLKPGEGRALALDGFNPDEHGGAEFWNRVWNRGVRITLEDAGEHEALVNLAAAESLR